jgi:hypothetical protein
MIKGHSLTPTNKIFWMVALWLSCSKPAVHELADTKDV